MDATHEYAVVNQERNGATVVQLEQCQHCTSQPWRVRVGDFIVGFYASEAAAQAALVRAQQRERRYVPVPARSAARFGAGVLTV